MYRLLWKTVRVALALMLASSVASPMTPTRARNIYRILSSDDGQKVRLQKRLYRMVSPYVGKVPYRFGGTSLKSGIDCSAFTQYVFRKFGVKLPRTAKEQARVGRHVSRYMLCPGDLVFFDASGHRKGLDHVGIYLGGGRFVHSVSPRGIMIQRLKDFSHPVVYGKRVLS